MKSSPLLIFLLCSALIFTGCDDESTAPEQDEPQYETVRYFWQGAYISDDQNDNGSLVIDAVRVGANVTAELVFQSYTIRNLWGHTYMKGTIFGDELSLSLDTDRIEYQYESTVMGTLGQDSELVGTFSYPGLVADIDCSNHTVDSLAAEMLMHLGGNIHAIASHKGEIWLSYDYGYTNGYLRMDGEGNFTDTTVVYIYSGALFISNKLTSDGTLVWGFLPGSIQDPGGDIINVSHMIGFDEEGSIINEFTIPFRVSGLASTESESWGLHSHTNGLHRYDASGAVLDSISVLVPDLTCLDYDGSYFWSQGWFLHRLYKIDKAGTVVAVFDLPEAELYIWPTGLTFDGTHIWISQGSVYDGSVLFKMSIPSFP